MVVVASQIFGLRDFLWLFFYFLFLLDFEVCVFLVGCKMAEEEEGGFGRVFFFFFFFFFFLLIHFFVLYIKFVKNLISSFDR
jgi:hypothetical protein